MDKVRIIVGVTLTLGYSSLIQFHHRKPYSSLPSTFLLLFGHFSSLAVYLFAPANSVYIALMLFLPFYGLCLVGPIGLVVSFLIITTTYLVKLLVIDPYKMLPLYFNSEGVTVILVIAFTACLALIPVWVLYDELRKMLYENQEETDRFSRIFYSTPVAFIEKDFTKLYDRFTHFKSESELKEYLKSKQNTIKLIQGLDIHSMNEKAVELYGYESEQEVIGKNLTVFVWDPISDLNSKILDLYNGKTNLKGIEQIRTKYHTNILVGYNIEIINHKNSVYGIFTILEITNQNLVSSDIVELNEKYENYLREFHHLVKNNLQFLISLIELMNISSYPSDIALDRMQTRLESMNVMYTLLSDINLSTDKINISDYIRKLTSYLKSKSVKSRDISFEFKLHDHYIDLENAIRFGMLLTEILTNAVEHAFDSDNGTIEISSKRNQMDQISYHIRDNGKGFDITKYVDHEFLMMNETDGATQIEVNQQWDFSSKFFGYTTLGLNLIFMLSRQSNTKVLMDSNPSGTIYNITTPIN